MLFYDIVIKLIALIFLDSSLLTFQQQHSRRRLNDSIIFMIRFSSSSWEFSTEGEQTFHSIGLNWMVISVGMQTIHKHRVWNMKEKLTIFNSNAIRKVSRFPIVLVHIFAIRLNTRMTMISLTGRQRQRKNIYLIVSNIYSSLAVMKKAERHDLFPMTRRKKITLWRQFLREMSGKIGKNVKRQWKKKSINEWSRKLDV